VELAGILILSSLARFQSRSAKQRHREQVLPVHALPGEIPATQKDFRNNPKDYRESLGGAGGNLARVRMVTPIPLRA